MLSESSENQIFASTVMSDDVITPFQNHLPRFLLSNSCQSLMLNIILQGWSVIKTPREQCALLSAVLQFDLNLSSKPGQFGILGETYYWTACYHLNLRLYIRLLSCVFDILDEAQILEVICYFLFYNITD